jgi:hypothetical protein
MLSFEVFRQQPDEKLALRKFQGGEACKVWGLGVLHVNYVV